MITTYTVLLSIVFIQITIRIIYSYRLYPEADYCMNSQYDVVVQNGGRPGQDYEFCWGAKLLSYFACRWARRLLPFGIFSPRIAIALIHGMATILVYMTTMACTGHILSAIAAASVYAVTSSLIHSGTYVLCPENFDNALLPLLAMLVFTLSLPGAIAAAGIVAMLTAYSKMVNALYFFPVTLCYIQNGDGVLTFAFIISYITIIAFTMLQYRFSPYYQPFSKIFGNAYRYATQTQDHSKKRRLYINAQSIKFLWKAGLREIPVIPFALLLSPYLLLPEEGARIIIGLAWTGVLIMMVQNKLWPIHFYPTMSTASILSGILIGETLLAPIALLLFSVSLYFFFGPLRIPKGQLSKYFWQQGSGALHYLDDEASIKAAHWIGANAPDTRKIFCWGMQTQLYTLLEIIGPGPIQHFSKATLRIPSRQKQLKSWIRHPPPEFIFFSDPYFRYYPLSILEGITDRQYTLVKLFGEGCFPLYRVTRKAAQPWKRRVAKKIGFDLILDDFKHVPYQSPPITRISDKVQLHQASAQVVSITDQGQIIDEGVIIEWLTRETAVRPVVIYGLGAAGRYILALSRRSNISNVYYHDRVKRIPHHPLMPYENLVNESVTVFLGAADSTNIPLYFKFIAEGVPEYRIIDLEGLFGRSVLPGRMTEHTIMEHYGRQGCIES